MWPWVTMGDRGEPKGASGPARPIPALPRLPPSEPHEPRATRAQCSPLPSSHPDQNATSAGMETWGHRSTERCRLCGRQGFTHGSPQPSRGVGLAAPAKCLGMLPGCARGDWLSITGWFWLHWPHQLPHPRARTAELCQEWCGVGGLRAQFWLHPRVPPAGTK